MARSTGTFFTMFLVLLAVLIVPARHVKGAGDGTLLKRPPEETCHACHKTDRNAPSDPNSIKSHNSSSTGSTKWSPNGWGVAGGKYGEFLCTTCHTAHDTSNIYLLRQTIKTADGTNWATTGTSNVNVIFKKKASSDYPNPGVAAGVMGSGAAGTTDVCQVCHSLTSHFRWNGGGADQTHSNIGGASGLDCTPCHSHKSAFAHGGGAGGTGCNTCHGHDENWPGGPWHGTKKSHATHTQNDATDLKGPYLQCSDCHDTNNFPRFKDGDATLATTTVCDPCHSPGGTYDGVHDPVIGAKANWATGVYNSDKVTLQTGKKKWCAGCHDEVPSVSQGVSAPKVIGDEDGSYTYGTGWGFYKTGHGLPSSTTYPASGGLTYGAGKECADCHDFSMAHIDGNARTYSAASNNYQTGYRLKSIKGKAPMNIPRPNNIPLVADDFRLCFSCHDANKYLLAYVMTTSYRNAISGINAHNFHLDNFMIRYDSDWDGTYDSQYSCVTCHNVHGSTQLAMVNDGKLVNKEPGLQLYYAKDGVTIYNTNPPSTFPPNPPANPVTLDQSDGTIYWSNSTKNICISCHGANYEKYYRTPPSAPQAPVLAWTGESGYMTDGVQPNSGLGGAYYSFRVKYSDANYQIPRVIQVWVDLNDNGIYEDNEKFDMQEVDYTDWDVSNGKLYHKTLSIPLAGDGTLNYRFYASDGKFDATGAPTSNSTITLGNNAPVLFWTGESGYTSDGVAPDSGPGGSNFEFRVIYTDADNDAPSVIQVWVDKDNNGSYDAGEKYAMTAGDPGDTNYADGKLHTATVNIPYHADGILNYRFYASDGKDATGTPTTNQTLVVTATNTAPVLSWTGQTNYVLDGVNPDSDTPGSNFTFRVKYTDAQNTPPTTMQVWVDENNNDIYEAGEKYNMTPDGAGDSDYADGKLYTKTLSLAGAGNGIINYRFYASDGMLDATGVPTEDSFVTVLVNAKTVSCSGGKTYTTIQAAVNASSNGDTILVSDCIYTEKVTVDGKNITIKSVNGAATTIIDGGGSGGSVVKFQNGANSTLNGFTVRNGAGGNNGGGIYVAGSSPTIKNSVITTNTANQAGGGIYVADAASALTITNSTISGNTIGATNYGGGGLYLESGGAVISGSTFNSNTATNYGGGISIRTSANASLSVSDTTFTANQGGKSGAIYADASAGTVTITITGSTFTSNVSSVNGGAIFLFDYGATFTANISDSTFAYNTSEGTSICGGGALYLSDLDNVTISGSVFTHNKSGFRGGAIVNDNCNLTITDSTINSNTATNSGGGLWLVSGAANVVRTTISGNQAGVSAGGVYASGGASTFTNCMVTGNKATTYGGGLCFEGGATPNLTSCTIAGNYATSTGGALSGNASLKNCILWNNHGRDYYPDLDGTVTASYSDIYQQGYSGSGNISTDPLFIDPVDPSDAPTTAGNYHLLIDSPAIDAGSATGAPADDIDGNVRPIGAGFDMGAYEVVTVANNAPLLTWTGEPGFASDGVNPYMGASGSSFEFRVNYSDSDNDAPSSIQVWVDVNNNGIYEAGEKYDMTAVDAGDTNYTDGKLYTKTLNLNYSGNGVLKYRFYAADGYTKATGQPTTDKNVVINSAPVLSWLGSGNYVNDGVHPDSGANGSSFEFRVRYTDADNRPPTSIQVWIDKNDNGNYLDAGEKLTMTAVDPADTNYTDGKDYTRTVTLTKAWDNNLKYRFYASNGIPATGVPTTDKTVTVANNVPTLDWTGEAYYTTDGVDPNVAIAGSSFTFRIKYTDLDNEAPTIKQVWVDADNSGVYDVGEKYDMTEVDGGDTNYTDGKLYTKTLTLNTTGTIKYKFVFSDGFDTATGAPAADSTVSVTGSNIAPVLSWTGETNYILGGVYPNSDTPGSNFTFRVKYTDAENTPPTTMQVWVDENDNGIYEAGEKYNMTPDDAGDTDYTNGKLYTKTLALAGAGDGILNYRFYASDGSLDATGAPTADSSVTVLVNARTVSCSGGKTYTTIQAAVNASSNGDTILVSDCTYTEKVNVNGKSITIKSVNGAARTIISGGGSGGSVVTFQNGANSTLNGFTVRNGAGGTNGGGIYVAGSSPTIVNSIITNNTATQSGGGIYIADSASTLTITNSTISSNTTGGTNGGGGLYLESGAAVISGSTFNSNTATNYGGGISMRTSANASISVSVTTFTANQGGRGGVIYAEASAGTTTITITGSTFASNVSSGHAGAIYLFDNGATSTANISDSTFTSNTAATDGGALYLSGVDNVTISGSTFTHNTAAGKGGAIIDDGSNKNLTIIDSVINSNTATASWGGGLGIWAGTVNVVRTTISGNQAGDTGGGVYAYAGASTFTNCMVTGNKAASWGGGLYFGNETPSLMNCTIAGNYSARTLNSAGGLSGNANLKNCIFWNNQGSVNNPDFDGTVTVSYSDISQTGYSGSGNISTDPLFISPVAPSSAPTTSGNYYLMSNSSAMDKGTATGAPANDIDGNVRPIGAGFDMGAEEILGANATTIGSATASVAGDTSINVSMSYYNDGNSSNTYTVQYKLSTGSNWSNWVTGAAHVASPYTTTITGLTAGATYDVRMTYNDADGINGSNPQKVPNITLTYNSTTAGTATATAVSTTSIVVSMPYTGDNNGSNTYSVDYKLHSDSNWTNWVTGAGHVTSPYTTTITGLTAGATYDVKMTYNDANGVNGTNPQTVSNITYNSTTVGTATATAAGYYSIAVSMPYTADNNGSNTYTVDYKLHSGSTWTNWVTGAPHVASPYTTTIAGLTEGSTYDVAMTYNDGDGVNGTNPQTVTVTLPSSHISVCGTNPVPFNKIQTTIADAGTTNGVTLLVCNGTYPEKVNFLGKDITVRSVNGYAVTFITGDNTNNPVVTFSGGETNSAVLDGFTISNQATAGTLTRGVYISGGAAPTIQNCNITGNNIGSTTYTGAGIYISGATGTSVKLKNSSVSSNSAGAKTGIYVVSSSNLDITDTTIDSNTASAATDGGTGVYVDGGTVNIDRSKIRGNSTLRQGGGIFVNSGTVTITNSNITGNVAGTNGGGANVNGGTLNIYNSTVAGNYAGTNGGGVRNNAATLNITNGIIYGNTSAGAGGVYSSGTGYTTSINYSSYQALSGTCTSCANNRTPGENPLFVNLQQAGAGSPNTAGNFHLCGGNGIPVGCTAASPVIDQGTNNGYTPDIDGDTRPQGGAYDMGSDEYKP